MRLHARSVRSLAVLAAVLLAGVAAADGLDKLPPDRALPQSTGSPGKVTFSHQSHVDLKAPGCTNCHPKYWKMLEKASTTDGQPTTHKSMEAGGQCGACHGKTAFNFDSCDSCHR